MITIHTERVDLGGNNRIRLGFNDNKGILADLNKLTDLRWSPTLKSWHIPYRKDHLTYLNEFFFGRYHFIQNDTVSKETISGLKIISYQNVPSEDRIYLAFDYNKEIIDLVKTLEGPYWHKDLKLWSIRGGKENFHAMVDVFTRTEIEHVSSEIYTPESIKRQGPAEKVNTSPLPEKFMNYMMLKNYSIRTIQAYEMHLSKFLTNLAPKEITGLSSDQINCYIRDVVVKNNYSSSYQNQMINAFKLYFRVMAAITLDTASVPRPKRSKKLPIVLSKEEISAIIKSIRNFKHRLIIMIIYGTGMRLSESVNLCISDIDFNRKLIHIRAGKGKKDRIVPLPLILISKLQEYLELYKPGKYLFEGIKGGRYSVRSVQSILKTALIRAKISKNASIHSLRHSFATHTLEQGTDIRLLQEILGHSSIKTTEIYTHVSNTSILRIKSPIDKIDL